MSDLQNKQHIRSMNVLGSTGSVGRQALDVARHLDIRVPALSCNKSVALAEAQIREFTPDICAVVDEAAAKELKVRIADTDTKILAGSESVCEAAAYDKGEMTLNSVTGIAGLAPSLCTIRAKKTLALANKETIVTAGDIVMREAKENNVAILPVDSEHSAIFQCLHAGRHEDVENIILTASGGPFFGKTRDDLRGITPEIALAHPTWNMGAKITIDSATLMNKGFEVIEAMHLFGVPAEKVKVVVHRESIIHSLVEYKDKSMVALLSVPDMRLCVQYAVTYPERHPSQLGALDLAKLGTLTFAEPDTENFSLLALAFDAATAKGNAGAVINGANEVAVALYLDKKIGFTDITDIVTQAYNSCDKREITSVDDVYEADRAAREKVKELTSGK